MFCKSETWESSLTFSLPYPTQFLSDLLNISPPVYLSPSPPSKRFWVKLSALLPSNDYPKLLNYCPDSTLSGPDWSSNAITRNIFKGTCPVTAMLKVLQKLLIVLRTNIRIPTVVYKAKRSFAPSVFVLSSSPCPLPWSLNSSPAGFHFEWGMIPPAPGLSSMLSPVPAPAASSKPFLLNSSTSQCNF